MRGWRRAPLPAALLVVGVAWVAAAPPASVAGTAALATTPPFAQQGAKIPYGGVGIALSADGNTLLDGGFAFARGSSGWNLRGTPLTGIGLTGAAMSAAGNTAMVGGAGGVSVFTLVGPAWTRQGPVLSGRGEAEASAFGVSVALSADGETALVGAPGARGGAGDVCVFTRSGSSWKQAPAKLTARGEIGAGRPGRVATGFGQGLALSADAGTAMISGYDGVWVFTRSGSTWTQRDKLSGVSLLGLSASGTTALVDSVHHGIGWAVARSPSRWIIEPGPALPARDRKLGDVAGALSADGSTALLGVAQADNGAGAAWAFTRSGSTWTGLGGRLVGRGRAGQGHDFGHSVALSANGRTAAVGDPGDGGGVGAVWMFTR